MTPDQDAAIISTAEQERPVDPRPAWERIAYVWLAREIDAGQPVDPTALAAEVSVAPGFARDLLQVLRAHRHRDPALGELRTRVVRDRIADAYLRRELASGGRLDPAELAAEVGTSPTVARQWLASLRAQHTSGQGLEVLREPVSHGQPSPEQLAGLQAHFAAGGHQHAAVTGRPVDPERLAAEVERHYWTREVRGGEQLRPGQLAQELGGNQRQVSEQLAEMRAGPSTAAERIAQFWHIHQQDPTARPLSSSQLARRLGVSDSYVRHVTWQLRARHGQPPLAERLAATHQQLTSPPRPIQRADGERDWRLDAACAQIDPELFFPQPGQAPQAAAAKQICAGCTVRGPCLEAAVHGPQARDDHSGIFAGTTARDRVRLRGRASFAEGTRFLQDRAAAEEALALANDKSIDRAAPELGVSKQALRRAFTQHNLPQPRVFQGGPQRTRFYDDRAAAEQAWRRAAEVGINQTRKELRVSDKALRTAWQRHGLDLPPRAAATPATPRLDSAFVALNRGLLPARERSAEELAAWVRRDEEYATLGAEVVVELNSESRTRRPTTRAWAIIRRAQRTQRAHQRDSDRQHRGQRRQLDRASRADRTSRSPAQVQEREVAGGVR
jgi:WhiB family transcriptional regulator, redox-sensing transcriptional regulator